MKKIFLVVAVLVVVFSFLTPVSAQEQETIIFLPIIENHVQYRIIPQSGGSYSLNEYMIIQAIKPGCFQIWPMFSDEVLKVMNMYHTECQDGYASILISFMGYAEIDGLDLFILMPVREQSYYIHVDGYWRFGYD